VFVLVVLLLTFSCVAVVSALCLCLWWHARCSFYVSRWAHRAALAERRLRDQGMLANSVAHELKNPITAIVCAAQTFELLLDSSLDAGQRSALRHIREHGEYVLSLMRDFIDVTRGVSGQLHSKKENVPVAGAVRAIAGMLEGVAAQKKVRIEIRGCDEVASLSVDPKHFKQILFNIAHNSVKFSPVGGKVVIAARQDGDVASGCSVTISVKDRGAGIEATRLKTIFDAAENFKAACREDSGCGLGLPITKALVDVEGAELCIRSNPGEGTEVLVTFAAAGVSEPVVAGRPTEETTRLLPLAGQKVLVVEDDPDLRESVSGLIRALGGVVDGVGEAVQALEAVQRTRYSTVVIDEYVGGLSADEVAQMMRSQPGAQEMRFVVAGDGSGEAAGQNSCSAHHTIEKPFDSKTLVASLLGQE
jgi:CheY-like chemotaxis protein